MKLGFFSTGFVISLILNINTCQKMRCFHLYNIVFLVTVRSLRASRVVKVWVGRTRALHRCFVGRSSVIHNVAKVSRNTFQAVFSTSIFDWNVGRFWECNLFFGHHHRPVATLCTKDAHYAGLRGVTYRSTRQHKLRLLNRRTLQ